MSEVESGTPNGATEKTGHSRCQLCELEPVAGVEITLTVTPLVALFLNQAIGMACAFAAGRLAVATGLLQSAGQTLSHIAPNAMQAKTLADIVERVTLQVPPAIIDEGLKHSQRMQSEAAMALGSATAREVM